MDTKLLRNWEAITSVTCEATRYALSVCVDAIIMARLAIAFPECYREGKPGEKDKFSWKHILRVGEKCWCSLGGSSTPYVWYEGFKMVDPSFFEEKKDRDLLAIPVFYRWKYYERRDTVPAEIMAQLHAMRGKRLKGPMFLTYQETRCVVGSIVFDMGSGDTREGHLLGYEFKKPSDSIIAPDQSERYIDSITELVLIPADVIAFNC